MAEKGGTVTSDSGETIGRTSNEEFMENSTHANLSLKMLQSELGNSLFVENGTNDPGFESLFARIKEMSNFFDADSLYVFNLKSNSAATFAQVGGKWVDRPNAVAGIDFFLQQMKRVGQEYHTHLALLMAAMLDAMRKESFPLETKPFFFDFLTLRHCPEGSCPVVSNVKIVDRDALNRPVVIMFMQQVCHKLKGYESDNLLLSQYTTSLRLDRTKFPMLSESIEERLTFTQQQYALDDLYDRHPHRSRGGREQMHSSHLFSKSPAKGHRVYSNGTRIAEKTTLNGYAAFKTAFEYLMRFR